MKTNQITTTASTELDVPTISKSMGIFSPDAFESAQRVCMALSESTLVPKEYQRNVANVLIAYDMAVRLSANPLMVMQSLYIVHGKPSWSASFICGMINSCGKYDPIRFAMSGEGASRSCIAWTTEKGKDTKLEGPVVSMQMARDEGWLGRGGSKWKTMPEVMLRYRAATFFGRLYAPELLLGMQTAEEVHDVVEVDSIEIPMGTIGKSAKPESIAEPTFSETEAPAQQPTSEPEQPAKPKRSRRTKAQMDALKAEQNAQADAAAAQESAPEPAASIEVSAETGGAEQVAKPDPERERIDRLNQIVNHNGLNWPDVIAWFNDNSDDDIKTVADVDPGLIKGIVTAPDYWVKDVQGFAARLNQVS